MARRLLKAKSMNKTFLGEGLSPGAALPEGGFIGFFRVFASWRDSSTMPSKALIPGCMQPGFQHAKTRGRQEYGLMDAHAEVHAHPLRPRVGTKPAATRPLADRELPASLREDLGEAGPSQKAPISANPRRRPAKQTRSREAHDAWLIRHGTLKPS